MFKDQMKDLNQRCKKIQDENTEETICNKNYKEIKDNNLEHSEDWTKMLTKKDFDKESKRNEPSVTSIREKSDRLWEYQEETGVNVQQVQQLDRNKSYILSQVRFGDMHHNGKTKYNCKK